MFFLCLYVLLPSFSSAYKLNEPSFSSALNELNEPSPDTLFETNVDAAGSASTNAAGSDHGRLGDEPGAFYAVTK